MNDDRQFSISQDFQRKCLVFRKSMSSFVWMMSAKFSTDTLRENLSLCGQVINHE